MKERLAPSSSGSKVEAVNRWAGRLTREEIHDALWPQANRRSHDTIEGLRGAIKRIYPDPHDQEMVFDGIALAIEAGGKLDDDKVIGEMLKRSFSSAGTTETAGSGEAA